MLLECGLNKTDLVLAAVSGGADSLALLYFLHGLGYPLLVCHFNHKLRPEADSDVDFVCAIANGLNLPFSTGFADVAAYAVAEGQSVEEAARELRYRFLFREARKAGAQAVATGHTADDQAETVLMHFLRGAGLSGLKGMPPRLFLPIFDSEIPLVRPLLGWSRTQTEAYCREKNIQYLTDSTNLDTTYFRNKLRHELLPQLEQYNPQIRSSLVKTARALQGDYQLLSELVDFTWQKAVSAAESDYVAFDRPQLEAMSPAMRRNLFRRAAFTLKPGLRDVDFDALERAASLKPVDLACGLRILVEGQILYLAEDESVLPVGVPQIDDERKVESGEYRMGNDWLLTCELLTVSHDPYSADNFTALLDADLTGDRLRLRTFRSGDTFKPLGMPDMSVKLSDLFVNLKIPKRLRKNWPLLCVDDEIAWIPGLRLAEKYKVTPRTSRFVKLQLKKLP